MKRSYYTILMGLIAAVMVIAAGSCKKVPVGFISDQISYRDSVMLFNRGAVGYSPALNLDGSTKPIKVRLVEIRDRITHKPVPEFGNEYDVSVFTQPFDVTKDTTVALINAKRKTVKMKPLQILEASGQVVVNEATKFIPAGQYEFDLEIENSNGKKFYPNIGHLTFADDKAFVVNAQGDSWFRDGATASGTIGDPEVTIKKISASGTKVILRIVDKNGVPFNPKNGELIKRGDRPTFESYAKFNPVQLTDDAMICDFVVAPFPLGKELPGFGGYLMYYRIPSQFAILDSSVSLDPADVNKTGTYSVNPRFGFRILTEGTFEVTIKLFKVTRKQ